MLIIRDKGLYIKSPKSCITKLSKMSELISKSQSKSVAMKMNKNNKQIYLFVLFVNKSNNLFNNSLYCLCFQA
jgi:hypothetical protein